MAELAIVFVFGLKMKNSLFTFFIYSTNGPFFRVKIILWLFFAKWLVGNFIVFALYDAHNLDSLQLFFIFHVIFVTVFEAIWWGCLKLKRKSARNILISLDFSCFLFHSFGYAIKTTPRTRGTKTNIFLSKIPFNFKQPRFKMHNIKPSSQIDNQIRMHKISIIFTQYYLGND